MAFINCDFFSESLGVCTSVYVILPQPTVSMIGMESGPVREKHPTLYLLHGLSDDHTIWMRRTSIERYASEAGIAVVMPAVGRSFYTDMVNGYNYWTYVSKELPALMQSFFPLSDRREDNFVAGLSMGGYGAFKMGLSCPDKFAAAASLSGAVAMQDFDEENDGLDRDIYLVYGKASAIKGSSNDLFHLADELIKSGKPSPKLFQCCGREDFLYESNVKFRDHISGTSLDLTYEEGPGTHEWGYWDMMIQKVIAWLPIADREPK